MDFRNENELKKFYFSRLQLIEEGLKRTRLTELGVAKIGRMDALVFDKENNLVILEFKNCKLSDRSVANVRSQVMRYRPIVDEIREKCQLNKTKIRAFAIFNDGSKELMIDHYSELPRRAISPVSSREVFGLKDERGMNVYLNASS